MDHSFTWWFNAASAGLKEGRSYPG